MSGQETPMQERAAVTLRGQIIAHNQTIEATLNVTINSDPTLHPSWTNDVLLRIALRAQDVITEELEALKQEREEA